MYGYLKRALEGEEKKETAHDMEVFQKSLELAAKYEIRYDGESFVPDNDRMADALFEAGLELFLSVGVYCTDTGRSIKFEEDEVLKALKATKTFEIGRFGEKVKVSNRYPMDSEPPVIIGGPMGGTVSEENFLAVHLSSAIEPMVQGIYAGALESMGKEPIKAKSPLELLGTLKEARLERLAARLANREGLTLMGPGTPTIAPAYMLVSGEELYSRADVQEVYQLDELKIDYEAFSKAIFHQAHGNNYLSGQCPVFGGTSIGSAEGLAIVDVAETIQSRVLLGSSIHVSGAVHINTNSSSVKEVLWASNLSSIAISRNMNYYTGRYYWNLAGCCTDMMFYETAAQAIGDTVSGRDMLIGPVGGRGAAVDHSTGLESRFMGEIADLASDLSLSEADGIIEKIYAKYEPRLSNPPAGKSFAECYTMKSEYEMQPTDEYTDLYRKIFSEIEGYCCECI